MDRWRFTLVIGLVCACGYMPIGAHQLSQEKRETDQYPNCKDSGSFNCSTDVCAFDTAFHLCPRTCNLCGNPLMIPCVDIILDFKCAELPNPCSDALGMLSCPLFCGLCVSSSSTPASPSTNVSHTTQALPFDLCSITHCHNGGTCFTVNKYHVECKCPPGISGPICNTTTSQHSTGLTIPTYVATQTPIPATTPSTATTTNAPTCVTMNKCNVGKQQAEVVFMIEYAKADQADCGVDRQGDFIANLVRNWNIINTGTRFSIVSYHDTVEEQIHLDAYKHDRAGLIAAIHQVTGTCFSNHNGLPESGRANLTKAMNFVRETSFKGSRPGVPQVVIPIIHQMPTGPHDRRDMIAASQRLKDQCVAVLPILVDSEDISEATANLISSRHHRMHLEYVDDFDELKQASSYYGRYCD